MNSKNFSNQSNLGRCGVQILQGSFKLANKWLSMMRGCLPGFVKWGRW